MHGNGGGGLISLYMWFVVFVWAASLMHPFTVWVMCCATTISITSWLDIANEVSEQMFQLLIIIRITVTNTNRVSPLATLALAAIMLTQ